MLLSLASTRESYGKVSHSQSHLAQPTFPLGSFSFPLNLINEDSAITLGLTLSLALSTWVKTPRTQLMALLVCELNSLPAGLSRPRNDEITGRDIFMVTWLPIRLSSCLTLPRRPRNKTPLVRRLLRENMGTGKNSILAVTPTANDIHSVLPVES